MEHYSHKAQLTSHSSRPAWLSLGLQSNPRASLALAAEFNRYASHLG